MGIATGRWAHQECRSEQGLLLSTDEFVPLTGTRETGYHAAAPEPLSDLLARGEGEWIEVDPLCHCECTARGSVVEAGGGPVEAEGFVALTDGATGELLWVLHLADSEAFTAVSVDGDEIVAVAEEYPLRTELRIPLAEPQRLRLIRSGI